jgi:hypothetical protein
MLAVDESTRAQIDRILQSQTFRSSETLRRLLKFLAEKSLAGEADNLKEYSIGLDAFGKGSTYDPRHDSTVRIHVGRLRQKLTEYYQNEGKDDPIAVDLPKGGFKLHWQPRQAGFSEPVTQPYPFKQHPDIKQYPNRAKPWLIVGLFAVTAWALYTTLQLQVQRRDTAVLRAQWTPEIETIWKPFVASDRPLLISISAPLFVEFPGYGALRDPTVNRPEDIPNSKALAAMEKNFKGVGPQPLIYFTTLGDANVTFALGKLLASRRANVSIVAGNELSWQQLSENNAIYIGSPKFFNQQLGSMPVQTELFLEPRVGVHNPHPRDQEMAMYVDEHSQSRVTGAAYTLISHTPGPLGKGDVISFAGRNGAGILGAIGMFTQTEGARTLLAKVRKPSGEIPRYYQILLKVRFQDGVPLETSYVLHRELIAIGNK